MNHIYDALTHFKNLIQRFPHHGLHLLSLTQFFYDHVNDYTRIDLDFAVDGNHRELSGEEACEATENFAQVAKKEMRNNPPNIISEQEVANLKAHAKRLFGNEDVWVEMHRGPPSLIFVTSCYPTTNNQLRNSSNTRQQATINNRRVTQQQIQGRQTSFVADTSRTYTLGA
ncbi:hypothetical protein Tco_0947901, partial [Tanacetum coccineum]